MTTTLVPLPLVLGFAGLMGLMVGSFLNVVVHRVPAGLSVVSPPSACPGCGHAVRARDNVPVLSWLLLRGRCRDCRTGISARYPLVEAATGAAFVVTVWRLAEPAVVLVTLPVVAAGIGLALIDLDHGRLPFGLTAVTAALVVVATVGAAVAGAPVHLTTALVGAAVWFAVYGAIWFVTLGRGMGLGDVALAPVLGFVAGLVGVPALAVGLVAGFVLGAVIGLGLMVSGRLRRGVRVPHGPFLLAGAALGIFAGGGLTDGYLQLVGLS